MRFTITIITYDNNITNNKQLWKTIKPFLSEKK